MLTDRPIIFDKVTIDAHRHQYQQQQLIDHVFSAPRGMVQMDGIISSSLYAYYSASELVTVGLVAAVVASYVMLPPLLLTTFWLDHMPQ